MKHIEDSLTVVIRSVRERTEQLCKELIIKQNVSESHLFIVHEKPFSKAMEKSYRLGVDQNRPWTLIIDGDVLLKKGSISYLLKQAMSSSDETLVLSAKLLDKLLGRIRRAGNHLFRTSYLPLLMNHIKDYDEEEVRPESSVIAELERKGYRWQKSDHVIGLHDFEQHYHDIARKAFVHVNKHRELLGDLTLFWLNRQEKDLDYRAALIGLSKGLLHRTDVKIDVDQFVSLKELVVQEMGYKGESTSDFSIYGLEDVKKELKESYNYIELDNFFIERDKVTFNKKLKEKSYMDLVKSILKKMKRDLISKR